MLEGRLETMHCGARCFAVYGKEEVITGFIDHVRSNTVTPPDIRIIGGLDVMGRMKIAITGKIIESMSFDDFRAEVLNSYVHSK